jgi:hypothetical protein
MTKPKRPERRSPDRKRTPGPPSEPNFIGANAGWMVVWVHPDAPHILYRHEVIAWRIGTHQRVIPITVDDVPHDYAIEHTGRLYAPFPEPGTPARIYNSVDEYHRARIADIARAQRDSD